MVVEPFCSVKRGGDDFQGRSQLVTSTSGRAPLASGRCHTPDMVIGHKVQVGIGVVSLSRDASTRNGRPSRRRHRDKDWTRPHCRRRRTSLPLLPLDGKAGCRAVQLPSASTFLASPFTTSVCRTLAQAKSRMALRCAVVSWSAGDGRTPQVKAHHR